MFFDDMTSFKCFLINSYTFLPCLLMISKLMTYRNLNRLYQVIKKNVKTVYKTNYK